MTTHVYTKRETSKKSSSPLAINHIRKPQLEKTFINKITGKKFVKDEVQIMKYKRNLMLDNFKRTYDTVEYSWLEIGFDLNINERVSDIILKLKRNLKKIEVSMKGYVWLVDKGALNGNMHFHIIVAISRLNVKGKSLPECLKIKYKKQKVHSQFVSNRLKMINYLKDKEIYYIGKRKRVFGKSRNFER